MVRKSQQKEKKRNSNQSLKRRAEQKSSTITPIVCVC